MKYLILSFCFISLLVFLLQVVAQEVPKPDPIEVTLAQCLEKKENQTTAGMCNCTYSALAEWDKKLNTTYKSLLSRLDAPAKAKLITAQRQWVAFKEKEIDLVNATYGKAQGTMWQVVRASKVMELTKQRAMELEELLQHLQER
ncbi:MAG: lysozyme inhibitor LprI family protein [Rufibacter sp.]